MYPNNKQEADKFVAGLIRSIHDDSTRPNIIKQLKRHGVPLPLRLGNLTSQIILSMLSRVKSQAQRPPHMKLVLNSIKLVITELAKMLEITGEKVSRQDMQQAAKIAGDLIDGGMRGEQPHEMQGVSGPQQPQQQMPQQQQQQPPQHGGLLGGM